MFSQFGRLNVIKHGFVVAALLSLVACHSGQLPNAPDMSTTPSETLNAGSSSTFRIALSPFALRKSAGEQTESKVKTKNIGPRGGILSLTHERTKAKFYVLRKALSETVAISMQIKGSGPSAVVEFGPDGLHFDRPALLALSFPKKDVDPESLGGYLVAENGGHTPVPHRVVVRKNTITILIRVDHFSEYTGDGGEPPEEDFDLLYDEDEYDPYYP